MKICICGSAGFLGSNLVEACLRKNWDVLGIDNFATGLRCMADPDRVKHLGGKYFFVEESINNTARMIELFRGHDVVFLLAALPRVSFSVEHPLEAHEANATGTLSVLEASRQAKVKRVVFSCSSSIFGGVEQWPTPESSSMKPISPYALQKSTGAEYCRIYSELHGLETISLIYYNLYGKYQRVGGAYSTVVPAFFDAAVKGYPCRIEGDGFQSRDFCHVDNAVHANILAAEHKGKILGEKFNIANGETHSVIEVFEIVRGLMDVDLQKNHVKARLGDPRKSHADVSKALKVLGYKSKVGFHTGMKLTAEWWLAGCPIK